MNHYILIRRLRGPAFLLLVGALALLNQADILSWGKSWPLFLILAGVLALAADGPGYGQTPYAGAPYTAGTTPAAGQTPGSTAIVPAHSEEYEKEPEGGQS